MLKLILETLQLNLYMSNFVQKIELKLFNEDCNLASLMSFDSYEKILVFHPLI